MALNFQNCLPIHQLQMRMNCELIQLTKSNFSLLMNETNIALERGKAQRKKFIVCGPLNEKNSFSSSQMLFFINISFPSDPMDYCS